MPRYCVNIRISDLADSVAEAIIEYLADYFNIDDIGEETFNRVRRLVTGLLRKVIEGDILKQQLIDIVYETAFKACEDAIKALKEKGVIE